MKKFYMLLCCVFAFVFLNACGSDSAVEANNRSAPQEVEIEALLTPNRVSGIVTEIDGYNITLETFNMNAQRPEGMEFNGERPQMPEGFDGNMPEGFEFNGERPKMPEGFDGNMPEGFEFNGERPQMPEGFDGKMPEGFEFNGDKPQMPEDFKMLKPESMGGESRTISLENVRIMSGGRIADIDDISVGTMLTIDFDSNGNAVKVSINNEFPGNK